MIVETMNLEEIYREVKLDFDECLEKVGRLKDKYRRTIVKSKRFPIMFEPVFFQTKRNNKYMVIFISNSKKYERDSIFVLVGLYLRPEGLYGINVIRQGDNLKTLVYPPHFFQRYRQRILKEEISSKDTIIRYFKNNYVFLGDTTLGNKFHFRSNEGFLLGEKINHDIYLMKTIISLDMIKGNQIDLSEEYDFSLVS